jgi:protein-tyrosine phosphatase
MTTNGHRKALFICTGNYYRSRFAEAVFNHLAEQRGLGWRAFSRGLNADAVEGDLSPFTELAMAERGIGRRHTGPTRVPLSEPDLRAADLIVALKEAEHRPMMAELFPAWADRVDYWHVHDLDAAMPRDALPEIERRVAELVETLRAKAAPHSVPTG